MRHPPRSSAVPSRLAPRPPPARRFTRPIDPGPRDDPPAQSSQPSFCSCDPVHFCQSLTSPRPPRSRMAPTWHV
nr:hypothetical protein CFP56_07925 [Quercus suber]